LNPSVDICFHSNRETFDQRIHSVEHETGSSIFSFSPAWSHLKNLYISQNLKASAFSVRSAKLGAQARCGRSGPRLDQTDLIAGITEVLTQCNV
jgi:hypothetical protein